MDYSRKINLLDTDYTVASNTSLLYRQSKQRHIDIKKERKNFSYNKDGSNNNSYGTFALDSKKLHDLYRHV